MEMKSIRCANCGAEIKCLPDAVETECRYCGSLLKVVSSLSQVYSTVVTAESESNLNARAEALFVRGFLFLEDSEFETAHTYFNKGLDLSPTNDKGYFGLLLCKLKMKKEDELKSFCRDLEPYGEYQKALRFAPRGRKEQYLFYGENAKQNEERQSERQRQEEAMRQERLRQEEERLVYQRREKERAQRAIESINREKEMKSLKMTEGCAIAIVACVLGFLFLAMLSG